ncbi:MAG: DUF6256 family protein [Actinomycetota bacterium]
MSAVLRQIVVPLVATYALFLGVVWYWGRHPVPRPNRRDVMTRPSWSRWILELLLTLAGGYLLFLAIVLVFHVAIAGQEGALRSAVTGGSFLAFGVALPAFALLSWAVGRLSREPGR